MNDLRLILLGIGLLIIAVIYLWGTFKQKLQDRFRTRKITSFKKSSFVDVKAMPVYDEDEEVSSETLAKMDAFLASPKLPDVDISDFSLPVKTAKVDEEDVKLSKAVPEESGELSDQKKQSQDVVEDESRQQFNKHQIITFLIKASQGNTFSGVNILEATDVVGLKFGYMNIFHHHGIEGMESEESIFSLANMYEPGRFELDKMETYQTKGLSLFMQLPTSMDSILAFNLMQETAMRLADLLQGEIWSSKQKPIDEKTLQAMRDVAAEFS